MNFINDRRKLGVLVVESVDGVHRGVKVLDILCVHLEEGGILDHDVSYSLIFGILLPLGHTLLQLQ